MPDFKPKLLLYESLMFLAVMFITLFTGISLIQAGQAEYLPTGPSLIWFFAAFLIALGIILVAIRFLKTPWTFGVFFAFLIFIGAQIVFDAFLPLLVSIVLAVAVVAVRWWKPNIITHNFAIFLGVAGVSAQLGILLTVPAILVILLVLSVYDFIAVFKTKHMVEMFKDMMQRGTPMAIVVPEEPGRMVADVGEVSRQKLKETERKVLMLGTGDLAFPALFAVSAFSDAGIVASLAIIIGAIVGVTFNHYLLTIKQYKAIPALPFIALFSAIGYLIAKFLLV